MVLYHTWRLMGSVIKNRRPCMTIYKSGRITVMSWTMKALGLEPGDAINLWEEGSGIYLYGIKNPPETYRARLSGSNKGARFTCKCSSRQLAQYILDKMGGDKCAVAGGEVKDIPVGKGLQLILRHIC